MDKRIEFLYSAINDTQATIKAIDVKIGALLGGSLLLIPSASAIWEDFYEINKIFSFQIGTTLALTFFSFWISSIAALARAISAIDNPACHIVNSQNYKGCYYSGGLYKFDIIDAFLNRKIIKASKDIKSFKDDIPTKDTEIIEELAFEQMKLTYIRDIKIHRLNAAIKLSTIWIALGSFIFFYLKFI